MGPSNDMSSGLSVYKFISIALNHKWKKNRLKNSQFFLTKLTYKGYATVWYKLKKYLSVLCAYLKISDKFLETHYLSKKSKV